MTVFISEKDLSPTSNAKDRSNLNNRIQEINCLREKEENKEQASNAVGSEKLDQNNPDNSINNKENLKPVISQEEIMQKLNFLKEPEINYNKLLNQKIESDNEDVKNQNLEIVNGQTDEIERYAYQMILDEIYSDMYPQRVIVPYLRQKFDHDIIEETSPPKEDISESDTSISHTDTGVQISDTTVDQESELCLKWDSQNTLKYVNQIVQEYVL